ncbi:MAG TPA: hypothetical protein VGN27_01205 [Gaiellaceae bacterium]|nr:hypothetical protein [Gaiellaceae bacterium]
MRGRAVPIALVLGAVLAGALLGRAATAANTVPAGRVGQGSSATAQYAISGVSYTLDVNNPRNVAQVAFTISPNNPRVIKARLFNAGSWYTCSNSAGAVTCATTAPAVAATSANNLTVVATQ